MLHTQSNNYKEFHLAVKKQDNKHMKIITLIENLVYQQGLFAEHGLSIYIETENNKILFDTGQTGLFLQNAQKMGVNMEEIDTLVLSHGHYDHTGGLYHFLEKNKKARIFAKPDLFNAKYGSNNRFIGTILKADLLLNRLQFVDKVTEVAENIFIMPEIGMADSSEIHNAGLYQKIGNDIKPDEFEDELFLVIKQSNKINILTACSHKGITNICTTAIEHFSLPVGLILGGFHLKNATNGLFNQTIQYFNKLKPKSIGICHCTGVDKYAEMLMECDASLFYNYTGKEININ